VIEHLGYLKDVRPAYENCSVYVLPSYREGTPRTVLEAMAMGRPIITTDAPGCRETVRLEGGQTADCRLQTADCRPQTSKRLKTEDGRQKTLLLRRGTHAKTRRREACALSACLEVCALPSTLDPFLRGEWDFCAASGCGGAGGGDALFC